VNFNISGKKMQGKAIGKIGCEGTGEPRGKGWEARSFQGKSKDTGLGGV